MPGLNQTGPSGNGPMTGRGRGLCATDRIAYRGPVSNNTSRGRGAGYGRGRGLRRCLRLGFGPENLLGFRVNPGIRSQSNSRNLQSEIDTLQTQAEFMQQSLDAINERLTEMEKGK